MEWNEQVEYSTNALILSSINVSYHHSKTFNIWMPMRINSQKILLKYKRIGVQFQWSNFTNTTIENWRVKSTHICNNYERELHTARYNVTRSKYQMPIFKTKVGNIGKKRPLAVKGHKVILVQKDLNDNLKQRNNDETWTPDIQSM